MAMSGLCQEYLWREASDDIAHDATFKFIRDVFDFRFLLLIAREIYRFAYELRDLRGNGKGFGDIFIPSFDLGIFSSEDIGYRQGISFDCSPKRQVGDCKIRASRMHAKDQIPVEVRETLVNSCLVRGEQILDREVVISPEIVLKTVVPQACRGERLSESIADSYIPSERFGARVSGPEELL
jgi:hypothetical protein